MNLDQIIKKVLNEEFNNSLYLYEDTYGSVEKTNFISDDYFLIARDGRHHGVGFNHLWSNFIYDKYVKDTYDKKN